MDIFNKMLELSGKGFYCAQILMALALEADGKEDPELLRAMGGLNGGLGFAGDVCGALAGGCCFLSYFAGKGAPEEREHPAFREMTAQLVAWFKEYTAEYGGHTCARILAGDPKNQMRRCPLMVQAVYEKCGELLAENGVL